MAETFKNQGFVVTAQLLDLMDCDAIGRELGDVSFGAAGTRSLLSLPWCASLAQRIQSEIGWSRYIKT